MYKYLTALLAFIAILSLGSASFVEVPSTNYIYDTAKPVKIEIFNSEPFAQPYSIEVNSPTQYDISSSKGNVAGNRTENVFITLYPRSDLRGQTYSANISVKLGDERFNENIKIVFRETQQEQEQEQEEEEQEQDSTGTGFFTLFGLTATSGELVLDLILILIAAILLIAFIARFVKRMEGH